MRLFLSREYHWDALTEKRIQTHTILPIGNGNTVLVEFSNRHTLDEMKEAIIRTRSAGYEPLIAHVERYASLNRAVSSVKALVDAGAKLQMNAGSILGREGFFQQRYAMKLLKERLIYVVASDGHDLEERPPELEACAAKLNRKLGASYAEELLCGNALEILRMERDVERQR